MKFTYRVLTAFIFILHINPVYSCLCFGNVFHFAFFPRIYLMYVLVTISSIFTPNKTIDEFLSCFFSLYFFILAFTFDDDVAERNFLLTIFWYTSLSEMNEQNKKQNVEATPMFIRRNLFSKLVKTVSLLFLCFYDSKLHFSYTFSFVCVFFCFHFEIFFRSLKLHKVQVNFPRNQLSTPRY